VTGAQGRRFVFTVRQLTQYVKALIGQDRTLQDVWVRGEVSDLTRHGSGHWYFTLKDPASPGQLRCVMFREEAQALTFTPSEGMSLVSRGTVTVYEARGIYQLVVRELEQAGVGDLYLAFERLRSKLAAEGLFEESRKRPLPAFPRRIALLTSPHGAAVHDLVTTLRSRWPIADLVLIPTPVSGIAAAPGIVRSLRLLRAVEGAEVAVLARGGGAMEELSGFNVEEVARAIVGAPVPVVTGIGHETDFTIAEFVADLRAATPTAAAVAVTPDQKELLRQIAAARRTLAQRLGRMVNRHRRELALVLSRPVLRMPRLLLAQRRQRLDDLLAALPRAASRRVAELRLRWARAKDRLAALSPRAVLARGFSITRLPDGSIVRAARQLAVDAAAELVFYEGSAEVRVSRVHKPGDQR
jgi:exodeoxyribonuclease VII large subunit